MSDLIDRQAAIDAVKHAWAKGLEPSQYIEQLPAVQPEPKPDENGSEPFGNAEMLGDRTTDDCISRQAAIETLNEQIEYCNKALGSFDISPKDEYAVKVERASLEVYKEQLENLPSVQPEIIRCKDCKHMITHEGYGYLGEPAYTCEGNMEGWVWPDSFCSYAERKDGD